MAPCDGRIRYKEWTPEQFRKRILEIVRRKDRAAQKLGREEILESLDLFYVVIHTDEFFLKPEDIRDYLRQPVGPKPRRVDEAYVLGPYEPTDNAHTLPRREDEPMEPKVEHTAFRVRWGGEN